MGPPAKEGRSHRRRTREKDSRALNPENRSRAPQLCGLVVPRARPLEVAVPRSPTPPRPSQAGGEPAGPTATGKAHSAPELSPARDVLAVPVRGYYQSIYNGRFCSILCEKKFSRLRDRRRRAHLLAGSRAKRLSGPAGAAYGLPWAPAPSRMPGQRASGPALLSVASTRRCPDPPCSVPI